MLLDRPYGREQRMARPQGVLWRRVALPNWVDSRALGATARAFVLSRGLLLIVTYLVVACQLRVGAHPAVGQATLWDAWSQWDARWYLEVAFNGYQWLGAYHYSSVAFFPGYPLLIRLAQSLLPTPGTLTAMLVSNACFLAALYVLHRLVQREYGPDVAARTLLYLALFPTAFFFFAGYSESSFLLWSVLSVDAMRRRRWVEAGLWGCLAALTRSMGLALMVPFVLEWWQAERPGLRGLARGAWIALIPLGTALFALYLDQRFGNPLLFDRVQRAWHRTLTWPWTGIGDTLRRIEPGRIGSYRSAHNLIELLVVIGIVALIALGWRDLPLSFSGLAVAMLLVVLISPSVLDGYYLPLRSTSRFCLVLFPCFITLARLARRPFVDRAILALGPAAMAILGAVFLVGGWVA